MKRNVLLLFPKTGFDFKGINVQLPIGLLSVAAPLFDKGYDVSILDQRLEKDFYGRLKEALKNDPVCVGITSMTGAQILYALRIARFVRRHVSAPIVMGGIHASLLPDQTLSNGAIDIVVRGEGELTFLDLVGALDSGGSLAEIGGISFKENGHVHHGREGAFIDLARSFDLPYDRVCVEDYIFAQVPGRERSLDVYTSRGCPWNCIFCYNRSFNRKSYRKKPIDPVLEEIEYLSGKFHLDSFNIGDDNFFVDKERTHYFCRSLIDRGSRLEWGCQGVRIDSMEAMDLDLLERSGLKYLCIGIESGSDKILESIKKDIHVELVKEMIERIARTRIIPHYNFMIGYPDESMKELHETFDLVDHILEVDPKAFFSSFHRITPYPGTEFFDRVQACGFRPPSNLEEWGRVSWESENTPWVSPALRKIYLNIALITYFIDPKVVVKVEGRPLLKGFFKIMMKIAKFRLRHRRFRFCPEFVIPKRLIEWRISKELSQRKETIR